MPSLPPRLVVASLFAGQLGHVRVFVAGQPTPRSAGSVILVIAVMIIVLVALVARAARTLASVMSELLQAAASVLFLLFAFVTVLVLAAVIVVHH
jgi:hypothetical protein